MKLQDAINKYIQWKSTYTVKACIDYRLHLNRLAQFVEYKPLEELTLDDIVHFQFELKRKYSDNHVAYVMIIIKNFLKFFRLQGEKCLEPALIKIQKNIRPKSHNPITEEEFLKMESIISPYIFPELQKKVILHLLWFCGLRVGELCEMNLSQIDLKTSKTLIKNKKNPSYRWLFWPEQTHELIKQFLELRLDISYEPALFINNKDNKRITSRSVQRWIKEIANKAGIKKKVSPHSFRHGKAHQIIHKGGNPLDVQKILGHSEHNPTASFHYLKLDPKEIEGRAKKWF